ncbi:hypothetical protein LB554_20625 [Mesorhizobium sp. CO1-1-11]|uniref:HNH endonuclease n=1 Tax=Mesorhizobium sp. CO1-1-11 TaxID=2876636 RepID=UPI001CCB4F5C|nr:hypothetical protein [Mesorhizobium sp. CO1-1-11]MBZ9726351.1 hypothetical protein [Mesorhizobium sp. CO1-1-11]
MWKLPKPEQTAEDVFTTTISKVANAELKQRLTGITAAIVEASIEFDDAASSNEIHTIAPSTNIGLVTVKEMSRVYSGRLAAKGAPGREIYDALMAVPKHGRCPLCGQHVVSTLDHYLPKTQFPALAVAPWNLIPACHDCNKAKADVRPLTASDETIHPYYDDIEGERWLVAEVVDGTPAALRFFVSPPAGWSEVLTARVQRQFQMLSLAARYAAKAAQELTELSDLMTTNYADGGVDEVRSLLQKTADSCRLVNVNGWRTASYQALSDSDWYCQGGFAMSAA